MFKRNWVIAATPGLTVLTTEVWGQSATEDEPRQEEGASNPDTDRDQQNNQAINLAPALEGIQAAIRDLIAEEDKIAAEAQQSRENRDLQAQEGMAKWAKWMFYATAATVALTLAALFAIIRTLHHTRRAADYTQDMLTEARNTTAASIRTLESTRAWVVFEQTGNEVLIGGSHEFSDGVSTKVDRGVGLTIRFVNSGQSPAIDAQFNRRDFFGVGSPPKTFSDDEPCVGNAGSVLGPGLGVSPSPSRAFDKTLEKWFKREINWFVVAQASYKTVFSEKRQRTKILIKVEPASGDFESALRSSTLVTPRIIWQRCEEDQS